MLKFIWGGSVIKWPAWIRIQVSIRDADFGFRSTFYVINLKFRNTRWWTHSIIRSLFLNFLKKVYRLFRFKFCIIWLLELVVPVSIHKQNQRWRKNTAYLYIFILNFIVMQSLDPDLQYYKILDPDLQDWSLVCNAWAKTSIEDAA